jgi:hypothetical protein
MTKERLALHPSYERKFVPSLGKNYALPGKIIFKGLD